MKNDNFFSKDTLKYINIIGNLYEKEVKINNDYIDISLKLELINSKLQIDVNIVNENIEGNILIKNCLLYDHRKTSQVILEEINNHEDKNIDLDYYYKATDFKQINLEKQIYNLERTQKLSWDIGTGFMFSAASFASIGGIFLCVSAGFNKKEENDSYKNNSLSFYMLIPGAAFLSIGALFAVPWGILWGTCSSQQKMKLRLLKKYGENFIMDISLINNNFNLCFSHKF